MEAQDLPAAPVTLPPRTEVVIEVPRGGFVKRDVDGRVDYVSPLPCPFNYGSVPGTLAADGAPIDAVVPGERLAAGCRLELPVVGWVDFIDAGVDDPKWVCSREPLTHLEARVVAAFFRAYGPIKGALNRIRGISGRTACRGVHLG